MWQKVDILGLESHNVRHKVDSFPIADKFVLENHLGGHMKAVLLIAVLAFLQGCATKDNTLKARDYVGFAGVGAHMSSSAWWIKNMTY